MARKKGDTFRLTPVDKELIWQNWLVLRNKSRVAKLLGRSVTTVTNVIKELEGVDADVAKLPAAREARAQVAARLQSRMHQTAGNWLDSIAEEDLQSGRIPIKDKDGKIVAYKEFGPSLLQKATAIGIITDKASVLQGYEQKMTQDINDGKLMMPQDVQGLVGAIEGKIKSLRMFDVRFEEDNADLVTNAQEVVAEVRNIEESRPEVVDMDEFDNPS